MTTTQGQLGTVHLVHMGTVRPKSKQSIGTNINISFTNEKKELCTYILVREGKFELAVRWYTKAIHVYAHIHCTRVTLYGLSTVAS